MKTLMIFDSTAKCDNLLWKENKHLVEDTLKNNLFEVQNITTLKKAVFWDVAPCRYGVNRRFGGTYRLHLQGIKEIIRKSAREASVRDVRGRLLLEINSKASGQVYMGNQWGGIKAAFTQDTRWLATSVWDTATQRHNTYT
jgi:hypothetical protein